MEKRTHLLIDYLKSNGETLTAFAARVGISRMHLYRVMDRKPTTTKLLLKISAATNGAVPVASFFEVSV